ncbi:hypothetical protein EXIGLDRAFT_63778 [Exidia glandulosa HHB12029]|uniref:F-box domain-containing protein n=1 Tax=Exidia glandulosa HHB12029 TaxID=1314781 RepID=A0A165P0V6_EXIGL|nr:hypothetical protein EXIGLDRAFT_63778 [Exidia glandulosa HHB12029]
MAASGGLRLPVELIENIVSFCDRDTLISAAPSCCIVLQAAEAILYEHVELAALSSIVAFHAAVTSNERGARRAGLVRKIVLLAQPMQGEFVAAAPACTLQIPASLASELLPHLCNLETFQCEWIGPSMGLLNRISADKLRSLYSCFDLDEDVITALAAFHQLRSLHIGLWTPFALGRRFPREHVCEILQRHPSALAKLVDFKGPSCCARALISGRPISTIVLDTLLERDRIESEIQALATGTCSLSSIQIAVDADGLAALSHLSRHHQNLESLALIDHCKDGNFWVTENAIHAAISRQLFPRLRIFRIVSTFSTAFHPDEWEEDEQRALVARWADNASPYLEEIFLSNVFFDVTGPVVGSWKWSCLWRRKGDESWKKEIQQSGWSEVS